MKNDKQGWKEMFENTVLAPLVIGCAVGGIGIVFEVDALSYIGSGIMLYGFFRMLYDG
ncbi:hypothetical protein OAN48_00725 [Pelagibacteraceae bacterium]|nr:hypothetical protein [Pelagibacteraceae bacterium]